VQQFHHRERSGFTLVLGGGGATAVAYSVGALRALSEHAGVDSSQAKVIVGTSAGAIVAADLRLGRSFDEIAAAVTPADGETPGGHTAKAWRSTPDLLRRAVGSWWIMARTVAPVSVRLAEPPELLQRVFPGSLFLHADRDWARNRFPAAWPEGTLWLVTSDLDNGRRVVLGAQGPLAATLPQAVQASCAVPGLYPPVRVDGRRLVDGGVHSVTNLDLAARTRSAAVIAVAPMGFDPRNPPGSIAALMRVRFNAQIDQEGDTVRRSGAALLVLRPSGDEMRHHGINILSRQGTDKVMAAAYESVARRLVSARARRVVDLIHQPVRAGRT